MWGNLVDIILPLHRDYPTPPGGPAYTVAGAQMRNAMTLPESGVSNGEDLSGATHESQLVDQARRGNQAAFGELVVRYERRLIRVILQFVKNQELAEDLAQEAFLKAYQRLGQFDTARRFGPWLFRIGVNQTLDYLRRRKRRGWWLVVFGQRHGARPRSCGCRPTAKVGSGAGSGCGS